MRTRLFQLSDEAARTLEAAYQATKDGAERTRLQAVRLYGQGYSVAQIRTITGTPRSSLMDWCRAYRAGGVAALADHRVGGNSAKLSPEQITDLSNKLRIYTPRSLFGPETATADGLVWTVPDLKQAVAFWYSVSYQSLTSYYNLFARCRFSYHQPATVFKSRRETDVIEFEAQLEKN
jgi:transposase